MYVLWWIVAGIITGWATGKIMGGSAYVPVVDIMTGTAGSILAGCMMRAIGSHAQGGNILVAIGSAMVLTVMYGLLVEGREARQSHSAERHHASQNRSLRRVAH